MKLRKFVVLVPLILFAQPDPSRYNLYSVYKETTGAEVITIQQRASGSRNVVPLSASITSSAADSVTIETGGTAASTTALTINKLPPTTEDATFDAFSSSNVGAGTVHNKIYLPAAIPVTIDLENIGLFGDGTTKNLTIRRTGSSGTITVSIIVRTSR